jgi:hypothetical protein
MWDPIFSTLIQIWPSFAKSFAKLPDQDYGIRRQAFDVCQPLSLAVATSLAE